MSFLSRLFRKAPTVPVSGPRSAADKGPALAAPSVPEAEDNTRRAREAAARQESADVEAAIAGRDLQTLARLVTEGHSTRTRQAAAAAIEDPAVIRQLIRDVRGGNDKSVYKILTARRDAAQAEERRREQQQAEIAAASSAIEKHSHRPYDALFAPTLEQMELRWNAVAAGAEPALVERTAQAIDRAREVIARHLREVAAVASRELAAANAAAEAQRQRELAEKAAAAAAAERSAAEAAREKEEAEKREALARAIRQVGGLIRKARVALDEGATGRAAGLRRAIEEKLNAGPPLPPYLVRRIQQLDEGLNVLKDWKSFSVAPKRAELIEEIESLVGADLDAPLLAQRIRDLREQWRTLSRGAGESEQADWERFQAAAAKAYEPCREYFEAQSLQRQENLQFRESVMARLEAFESSHDWEHDDWRAVAAALRESKQLWRRYSPVDRSASKAIQERFDAATRRLQSRLDAEYERNAKEKKSLIERAQRLVGSQDSRKATEDVKELQKEWQSIGPAGRRDDQALWEEFRHHCDAVFEKRQQDSAEFAAALRANRSRGVELCEHLEQLAAAGGPALLQQAAQIDRIRTEFALLGEFPRGDSRELHRRFERAVGLMEDAVAMQRNLEIERGWRKVFDAADCVRAYRLACLKGAESAALKERAQSAIESLQTVNKAATEALRKALLQPDSPDPAASESALRLLCVRAEILTGRPSPVEDQALRRQYQVQRLVEGMGQGLGAEAGQLDALAVEWSGIGPTDDAVYAPLLSRFLRCRTQGEGLSPSSEDDRLDG